MLTSIIVLDYSAPQPRTYERRTQRTRSPRSGGPAVGRYQREGRERRTSDTTVYEPEHGASQERIVDSVRDAQPDASGKDSPHSEPNPAEERSPVPQNVPRFSPMPSPVIEEPLTPPSERERKFPNVSEMASASGSNVHPKASLSPAPVSLISQVRSSLMSSRSSVSSFNRDGQY
jgi:hypothetical protein